MKEQLLIKKCKNNNKRAQKILFDFYYQKMLRITFRYVSNVHDAEDALMRGFSNAFKHIGKFVYRGEGSLDAWLSRIIVNESIKMVNRNNNWAYLEDIENLENEPLVVEHDQLEAEDIYKLVAKMPVGYRTIFNLYVVEGFSHAEIAQQLNISISTSKTQLLKGRKYLRNKINSYILS